MAKSEVLSPDNLLIFLRNPSVNSENIIRINGVFDIFKISFLGYLLLISTLLVFSMAVRVPLTMVGLMPSEPIVKLDIQRIVQACLLAPIYEELIFRLSLRFKPGYLLTSLTLFVFLIGKKHIGLPISIIFSILVLVVGFYSLFKYKKVNLSVRLAEFWQNHYTLIFYSSVLIFGLMHIFNYTDLSWKQYLIAPLIVLPQIIMGLFFGYVRLKYDKGIYVSILMHSFNNIVSTLIRLLTVAILFYN